MPGFFLGGGAVDSFFSIAIATEKPGSVSDNNWLRDVNEKNTKIPTYRPYLSGARYANTTISFLA